MESLYNKIKANPVTNREQNIQEKTKMGKWIIRGKNEGRKIF